TGTSGPDTLNGGAGADTMWGFQDDDTYIVNNAGDAIKEDLNGGTGDLVRASVSYTLPINVEYLVLEGSGAINGTGNFHSNTIQGNDAANRLDGAFSDDVLIGDGGDDVYVVDNPDDLVIE